MEKEQRQPLRCLRPAPLTHLSVIENPCGLKRKHRSLVLPEHHAAFTRLLEDPVIKRFLAWDKQMGASDKYLLATVIAYFSRAGLFPWEYQRIHFFLALYLANDMEEDDHILKQGIFLFLYNWNLKQISEFHKLRYQFICCMDWNLRVTREECEEIQAYDPALWVWSRDRALIPGPWYPENSALKKRTPWFRFLAWDKNLLTCDQSLLAMVIAHLSQAGLFSYQYQRIRIFLVLSTAPPPQTTASLGRGMSGSHQVWVASGSQVTSAEGTH
ncbi:speedy protein E4-like [Cavia porcellus]|uniref:speedy protein E4-like n=1 Tax=Cavia porcellus TaxID=10141 RepID=UPI000661F51F